MARISLPPSTAPCSPISLLSSYIGRTRSFPLRPLSPPPPLLAALLILALALLPAIAVAQSTLLILGDSLSAGYGLPAGTGWVDLLQRRIEQCAPHWRLINASVSGETTAGGRARITRLLQRHNPHLLILALGANDGLRGLPPSQIRANLAAIMDQAAAAGARTLLIGMKIPPNLGPEYTEQFANLYGELARTYPLAGFVPFLLAPIALDPTAFQADGLHPTAAAQSKLLETIWPHLAPLLGCSP
ncbi:MAG: arylesterase [Hydrogenophilus sp.]|nr:arylesterase [Hydrogenophilus sp.]